MNKDLLIQMQSQFDQLARNHPDEPKVEFWFARDLQEPLGYARWENFLTAIQRAIESCRTTGCDPDNHFRGVTKMVPLGSGAERPIEDFLLTHELGFFREFRRKLGASHPDWCCLRLEGTATGKIEARSEKTDLQKAEEYLHGHNLDEAGLCLRKACEDTAKRFNDHNEVLPTKEFLGLADALRAARNRLLAELPVQLYEKVLRNTPEAQRHLLVAATDEDLENNPALDRPTKGRLKTNRERLRRLVRAEHVERMRQIKLIDDILACTERVLNPAAHSGNPPLYEREVQDALNLIKQLETTLSP